MLFQQTGNMMPIRRTKNEGRIVLDSLSFTGNNGTEKFPLSAYSRSKDGNNKTRIKHESKRYMRRLLVFSCLLLVIVGIFSLIHSLEVEVTGRSFVHRYIFRSNPSNLDFL